MLLKQKGKTPEVAISSSPYLLLVSFSTINSLVLLLAKGCA
jgi:hypothetical protein